MKNKSLILTALTIAALATGCKPSNPADENTATSDTNSLSTTNSPSATNAWQQTKEATTNAWSDIKQGTTNAWADVKDSLESTKDYTYDKKDAFVASASADLTTLDQKIQALSDKAANASDSVKADAQAKLQDLRNQRAILDQKLDAVKNSTEANWDSVKADFQNSYASVKSSLKQAWQWLKDQTNS
jgi:predicted  nucleic acid-binding Zn-ribbon protein